MTKYVNKRNVANVLLLGQFGIIKAIEIYEFTPEVVDHLSFILLVIGYFINTQKNKEV